MKPFSKRVLEVKIVLSPSTEQYKVARARYEAQTGCGSTYDFPKIWECIINEYNNVLELENISISQAEVLAEPIRIMFPGQNVNIIGGNGDFVGNVTWNDQLKMFWGYPTFTEIGKAIMTKRTEEQAILGIKPSWA
jgi:hypothetical protein